MQFTAATVSIHNMFLVRYGTVHTHSTYTREVVSVYIECVVSVYIKCVVSVYIKCVWECKWRVRFSMKEIP